MYLKEATYSEKYVRKIRTAHETLRIMSMCVHGVHEWVFFAFECRSFRLLQYSVSLNNCIR